tara:strand:+ start:13888 stop:14109 length:222 start_codon:yes stop_codon:yes gene_type:complete
MKAFVIMEIGWEYNDENYYRPQSAGGKPKAAYTSKVEAQSACYERNIKDQGEEDARDGITHRFEVVEVELVNE